jgi:hypothetical protein
MEAGKAIALTIAFATAIVAHLPAAIADDREARARELFERAGKLRDAGDLRGALARYQAAYDLVPNPQILLNQSAIYLRLGWTADLANVSQQYIDHPDAEPGDRDDVARSLVELDRELGVLMLRITETGTVTVDGRPIGTAPIARKHRVAPGRHVVALRGDDIRREQTIVAKAGAVIDVVFDDVTTGVAVPLAAPRWSRRPSTFVAAGAIVALGVGIGFWTSTDAAYDRWTSARDRTMPPASAAELADLEATVRRRALGANLCFGVAAAAAATAGILYYRERVRTRREVTASISAIDGGVMAVLRVSQ